MSLSCTLYKNTGFNTLNIPDSKALLVAGEGTAIKTTALDVLQNKFLQNISVSTTWEEIQNVDYANINDFYYFVTSIQMTSYDVATLSLEPDFVTSAGGPAQLIILDGITERHHISKADDAYGKYDEADPLLVPSQPLQLEFGNTYFLYGSAIDSVDYYTVCESSIDLVAIAMNAYTAITYTDANDAEQKVTIPHTTPVAMRTTFSIDEGLTTETNGTCLFDVTNENVQKGMQLARDMGAEDAIIAQYALPKNMFSISGTNGYVTKVTQTKVTGATTGLPFKYADVRNQRTLSGENNRYGILSVSGNSYEANPEQIYIDGLAEPSVIYKADGRENGKPFYNFSYYLGASNSAINAFFRNAIAGMEWRNVPLRFVSKSGSIQDAYNFQSQQSKETFGNTIDTARYTGTQGMNAINLVTSTASGVAGVLQNVSEGKIAGAIGAGISTAATTTSNAWNMAQNAMSEDQRRFNYNKDRAAEAFSFGISQNVVIPTIKFPFQEPSLRDYYGNGVITYRYKYADTDIKKIDKILTAYGYHITEMLTPEMFSNRPHFNFVKANGVTIGNNLPNWWKAGIAEQFSAGVRIWHVKPGPAYYTQNE